MTAVMYAVGTLSVAVAAIPLAFIAWRMTNISFRWLLPIAFCLVVMLMLQGIDALGGRELIMALIYLFAGAGKQ